MSQRLRSCLEFIQREGVVSVFPAKGKRALPSLFRFLHPRSSFSWVWDENGDDKVVKLWWLKNEIAASKKVLYGRFFTNQPVFVAFARAKELRAQVQRVPLGELDRYVLELLEQNSPQTLRMMKRQARLEGRDFLRSEWQKSLLKLQKQFLICSLGDSTRESGPMPSTEYVALEHFFDL